jgi:hypothetical protein
MDKYWGEYYNKHPECHKPCPVEGCDGFCTTSKMPNLLNHIKGFAKTELFKKQFFSEIPTPHFDYIKKNYKISTKIQNSLILK